MKNCRLRHGQAGASGRSGAQAETELRAGAAHAVAWLIPPYLGGTEGGLGLVLPLGHFCILYPERKVAKLARKIAKKEKDRGPKRTYNKYHKRKGDERSGRQTKPWASGIGPCRCRAKSPITSAAHPRPNKGSANGEIPPLSSRRDFMYYSTQRILKRNKLAHRHPQEPTHSETPKPA